MAGGLLVRAPMRLALLCSLLLAATGCGREPDAAARPAPLQGQAAPSPDEPVAPGPASGSPAVAATPPPAVALLGAESRAALADSPVPMLVLPERYAAGTTVMRGPEWAALSYRDDELTLSLHATRRAHPVIDDEELLEIPPADQSVRGEPARVTINEAIRSVGWIEDGVAYALEVECARPMDDVRCTESDFVLALAEQLVAAGAQR